MKYPIPLAHFGNCRFFMILYTVDVGAIFSKA